LRELFVGGAEVVEQLLVGGRLFERVELLPMQVLEQRIAQHVCVRRLADDRRDVLKAGLLGRAPAALAHDQLVLSFADLPDHDRLEEANLGNRGGQLFERFLVESPARLARIRRDGANRDFLEIGARHLAQPGSGHFLRRGESVARLLGANDVHGDRRAGHRTRERCGAGARCLRNQCSESLAETSPLLRHWFSLLPRSVCACLVCREGRARSDRDLGRLSNLTATGRGLGGFATHGFP
jgi:hypothetical protein